jgi:hypothetical protein
VAVTAGAAAASATVTLARTHFAGAVALAAAGAPAGLTVTVPGAPVAGDTAALGVQAAASVPAGDYPVTLTGSAAGLAPVTATLVVRVAAAAAPAPPATGVTPGFVTGTVVDAAGRPLAGVRVYAKNTLLYNTNAIGVTDAQGRYKLDVREPMGTWRVTAQLRREYEGHTYTLDLHPENDEPAPFAGVDGAVRNFSWRVSGRTPSGGYYGGRVYVSGIPGGWMNDVEHEDLELEFTPVGPLIDGSVGAPRTLRGGVGPEADHVPLGKYRVTAWAAPAGAPRRRAVLRVSVAGAPYVDEVVVTWPVDLNGWAKRLAFDVAAPQ